MTPSVDPAIAEMEFYKAKSERLEARLVAMGLYTDAEMLAAEAETLIHQDDMKRMASRFKGFDQPNLPEAPKS